MRLTTLVPLSRAAHIQSGKIWDRFAPALQSAMDCTLCQHLESELGRLVGAHAEKARMREDNWQGARSGEHSLLRSAENDAMLKMEIARAELNRHRRNEHDYLTQRSV